MPATVLSRNPAPFSEGLIPLSPNLHPLTFLLQFSHSMNHLWSPWRMEYIENSNKVDGCVFCVLQEMQDGTGNLIAYRGRCAFVILNRYPYTSGHLMVVPYEHKSNIEELDAVTRAEMMELTTRCMAVLRKSYNPQGFNMGANIGEAAGAGVKDHVHIHIVPRWAGDTNFMSTVGEARVLPESLETTFYRVKQAFAE
jgi:ATP adenylyltransferase